jgi:hypothetical protein
MSLASKNPNARHKSGPSTQLIDAMSFVEEFRDEK